VNLAAPVTSIDYKNFKVGHQTNSQLNHIYTDGLIREISVLRRESMAKAVPVSLNKRVNLRLDTYSRKTAFAIKNSQKIDIVFFYP